MGRYIIKRLLLAVLTVFIICALTFFVMHAVPGGPFNREKALSEATVAALNARYGLDKPLMEQFLLYMKGIFHGDFGVSLKKRSWVWRPWPSPWCWARSSAAPPR